MSASRITSAAHSRTRTRSTSWPAATSVRGRVRAAAPLPRCNARGLAWRVERRGADDGAGAAPDACDQVAHFVELETKNFKKTLAPKAISRPAEVVAARNPVISDVRDAIDALPKKGTNAKYAGPVNLPPTATRTSRAWRALGRHSPAHAQRHEQRSWPDPRGGSSSRATEIRDRVAASAP